MVIEPKGSAKRIVEVGQQLLPVDLALRAPRPPAAVSGGPSAATAPTLLQTSLSLLDLTTFCLMMCPVMTLRRSSSESSCLWCFLCFFLSFLCSFLCFFGSFLCFLPGEKREGRVGRPPERGWGRRRHVKKNALAPLVPCWRRRFLSSSSSDDEEEEDDDDDDTERERDRDRRRVSMACKIAAGVAKHAGPVARAPRQRHCPGQVKKGDAK